MAKKGNEIEEPNYVEESWYMQKKIEVLQYRIMMKDEAVKNCKVLPLPLVHAAKLCKPPQRQ